MSGWASDFIITNGYLSALTTRKLSFVSGILPASVALAAVGHVSDPRTAFGLVTFAIGIAGVSYPGTWAYTLDVGGKHAPLLYATANAFGTIPGFLSPVVVGVFLQFFGSKTGWRLSFWASCAVGVFGCLGFCLGATSDVIDEKPKFVRLGRVASSVDESHAVIDSSMGDHDSEISSLSASVSRGAASHGSHAQLDSKNISTFKRSGSSEAINDGMSVNDSDAAIGETSLFIGSNSKQRTQRVGGSGSLRALGASSHERYKEA
eukprot:CAMPEP_0197534596 /NCGR_PEP_ID=MMETSP1318-20131121/47682_1 /TAXON_ID=552666 /ORGANISM="Partenskyella glossopodia, Strain RCC365" /LENGTH=262 /DNA_ID=CAMNT_0043091921 /DNA_START=73 /DNA_END=861 /DNA_ORIENTATION=+